MIERIPAAAYERQAWKNGLGVTEQIAVSPAGATLASGFAYRISRAQVTAGGPFSPFPGCDRILTVIQGDGLSLLRGETRTALASLQPFRFSGDEPLSALLERGAIVDFNVIFDRARIQASCEPLLLDERARDLISEPARAEHFLYCVSGGFVCDGIALEAGDSARAIFEPGSKPLIRAQTDACMALHVRLWRLAGGC